ncbi:AcrR family transcriptional regulator [Sagittula marina]|uniref:AcrR family transcriptional regulator n=1 Tax=Sagittula marina TaxID=943940 RepID=A0A7W6DSP2_9RHOB|nr:TetR/AcrR family transcriptional regulator [Sagittula marina]MBB3984479.1 AcrR family transcriptional regulator [Sagittula marina]
MTPDEKEAREKQIADAAYDLLKEKGFGGMSMLAVARKAKASNETLYRWYGDKSGLFAMLIARNVDAISDRLDQVTQARDEAALIELGSLLLELLLSPRAIELNRAAAADPKNQLGALLAEGGRGRVFPRVLLFFEGLRAEGLVRQKAQDAASLWLDLLVGDVPLRCVTGALKPPEADARHTRATLAATRVLILCG